MNLEKSRKRQIILKGGDKKTMKTKIKQEIGITLIALVVTIVVLLILAGVSVNALFGNSGIIQKAQNAQNKMNKATENDQKEINELNNWIENHVNGTESVDTPDESTKISFTIDNVTYQAEEGMTWSQWAESAYNTIDIYDAGTSGMRRTSMKSCYVAYNDTSKAAVLGTEKIVNNTSYYFAIGRF